MTWHSGDAWVLDAWHKIPQRTTKDHSFLKFGITNALNCSKDDALWLDGDKGNMEENQDDDNVADLFCQDERIELSEEEWEDLFGQSEKEEFHGF